MFKFVWTLCWQMLSWIHFVNDDTNMSLFQVSIIREGLAELYENEEQWSKAAQMLSGIDLESGIRCRFH